uniref:Uncharacterized protein n=1 Tax=Callorhinchus milii TaxID=7868 RepID=A0A4W3GP84_CALMI
GAGANPGVVVIIIFLIGLFCFSSGQREGAKTSGSPSDLGKKRKQETETYPVPNRGEKEPSNKRVKAVSKLKRFSQSFQVSSVTPIIPTLSLPAPLAPHHLEDRVHNPLPPFEVFRGLAPPPPRPTSLVNLPALSLSLRSAGSGLLHVPRLARSTVGGQASCHLRPLGLASHSQLGIFLAAAEPEDRRLSRLLCLSALEQNRLSPGQVKELQAMERDLRERWG